jgi:hypothetical protein
MVPSNRAIGERLLIFGFDARQQPVQGITGSFPAPFRPVHAISFFEPLEVVIR